MRIIITVDPEIPVPPTNYGGIERIVDSLIYEYREHGHEVYLVANSESTNNGVTKLFGWPSLTSRGWSSVAKNGLFLADVVKEVRPDIIHSFSRLMYLYFVKIKAKMPYVVQTYQREISDKSTKVASKLLGNKIAFSCCGAHMLRGHYITNKCRPIHNFSDTEFFTPDYNLKPEYLFFLGRIENIKGTKEAIEVALATNTKLIIAGNIQEGHDSYFDEEIKPFINHDLIEYVGPVNDEQKLILLRKAKALLFPIKWEEPFGIVMAEAKSCGVPVVGFRRGSVPEVVKEGVTGFVVDNLEEMINVIPKLDLLSREKVRQDAELRFSKKNIAKEYLEYFENRLSLQK